MKKLTAYAAIAVTIFAFLSTTTLQAQQWSDDEKAVWKEVENLWVHWKSGDMDKALANIHPDYLGWNNVVPMPITYDKWVNDAKQSNDLYSKRNFDIEPARIMVHGNAAVVHYYYNYSYRYSDGDKVSDAASKGKWSAFYIKENGKWMLLGDFTFDVPKK